MKNWGWFLLLAIGCLISAAVVVILIEKTKQSAFFSNNEQNTTVTLIPKEPVIDESTFKPSSPSTAKHSLKNNPSTPTAQPTQSPDNLISNSSFELNPLTTVPKWQTTGVGSQHIVEWSTEQAVSGQHALKISASQPSNRGWPGWQTQLDHQINSGYDLQAKYYTPDGANAWLELSFLDSNNRLIKGYSTGCPRTSVKKQWTLVERKVKAEWVPDGTRVVKIGLRQCLNHTKGRRTTLYLDDISLRYNFE